MKKESDEFDYENYPTNLYSNSFSPKDAIASLFKKNPSDETAYKLPDSGPVDYSEKTELVALPSNETPVSWQVAKMLNNYDDLHKKAGQQWDKRVISKKSVNDATKFYYDLADKGGAYIPIAALGATMTEDVYPVWRDMVTDPVNLALSLPSGGAAPALGIIKKGSKIKYPGKDTQVTLYRGLTKKFDPNYDLSKTDAPSGYSTWTDNPKLARQYAGEDGFVYEINLPANKKSDEYINSDGDRALFFNNNKKAGLNKVSGDEYLVYNDHELFDPSSIKQISK